MPVVSSSTDVTRRRIILVSELDAPPERVWDVWASPRRLERWWGPPGQPMTVEHHDLRGGGQVRFHVVAPDGTRTDARFEIVSTAPPHSLRFSFHTDALAPATVDVHIEQLPVERSRMTIRIEFPSDTAMRQAVDIGFDRGVGRSAKRLDEAIALDLDV
jgi:uncharacterized protein YndB with AHSA1/START domain